MRIALDDFSVGAELPTEFPVCPSEIDDLIGQSRNEGADRLSCNFLNDIFS